jgi:hypothetical protein
MRSSLGYCSCLAGCSASESELPEITLLTSVAAPLLSCEYDYTSTHECRLCINTSIGRDAYYQENLRPTLPQHHRISTLHRAPTMDCNDAAVKPFPVLQLFYMMPGKSNAVSPLSLSISTSVSALQHPLYLHSPLKFVIVSPAASSAALSAWFSWSSASCAFTSA